MTNERDKNFLRSFAMFIMVCIPEVRVPLWFQKFLAGSLCCLSRVCIHVNCIAVEVRSETLLILK